jgi:hypothetical protein
MQATNGTFFMTAIGNPWGGGYIVISITMQDNSKWTFHGGYGGAAININWSFGITDNDFPGFAHIAGSCMFEIGSAAVGWGGTGINFHDLQGQIGTIGFHGPGLGIGLGVGGGSWTKS